MRFDGGYESKCADVELVEVDVPYHNDRTMAHGTKRYRCAPGREPLLLSVHQEPYPFRRTEREMAVIVALAEGGINVLTDGDVEDWSAVRRSHRKATPQITEGAG